MKDLKKLGGILSKSEQKKISGGMFFSYCTPGTLTLSQTEGGPCILLGTDGEIGTFRNGLCCS